MNKKSDVCEKITQKIIFGIQNYCKKNKLDKVHLGLSGGIDSALVACLASEALGPARVTAIALPGPFSSSESFNLALELSQNLKCLFLDFPISSIYNSIIEELQISFGLGKFEITHENVQARLRGLVLSAFGNQQKNSLLLATGNLSELSVGYFTLYGDSCGGLLPIGDLLKGQVYSLAHYYNRKKEIIPHAILNRAPTAELRENQKDEDSLPPYKVLDKIIDKIVNQKKSPKGSLEKRVHFLYLNSDFKRKQSPPKIRVFKSGMQTLKILPPSYI